MSASRFGFLLGNSTLRYGSFDGPGVGAGGVISWAELEREGAEGEALSRIFGPGWRSGELVAGSVRDDRLAMLAGWLEMPALLVAGRDFEIPIENHYEDPAEAGVDRLLNALAGRTRWPGEALVVVDFGTALSFSVVSARGEFLGGPIGVGVGAALRGLETSTPNLPGLQDGPAVPLIARSTSQALRSGILGQARLGVQGLVQGILDELGGNARVIATGGEAELVAAESGLFDCIEPGLTLEGLAIAAETGSRL